MSDKIKEYKGYQVKPHPQMPAHCIVVTAGKGGKIPAVLEGMFTSPSIAYGRIDSYLESKEAK